MHHVIDPEDPDPFNSRHASPRPRDGFIYRDHFPAEYPWPISDVARSEKVSVAAIAFIPPKHLTGVYAAFADDGVNRQPDWLSRAFLNNRFRFAHGLRVTTAAQPSRRSRLEDAVIFAKANPTTVRGLPFPRFAAPVQVARPSVVTPPPTRQAGDMYVSASHARSKNGFLATKLGAIAARARKLRPEAIPQIGISLQVWFADYDECKCVAIAHNFFPKYDLFIDGIRFDLEHQPNFAPFDAYDLDVQWQAFFAVRLYETLRPFPLVQRYPGACLAGWYKSISSSGEVEWCDSAPAPVHVEFDPPSSNEHVVEWWRDLETFVARFDQLNRPSGDERRRGRDPEARYRYDERLAMLWRKIGRGARLTTRTSKTAG